MGNMIEGRPAAVPIVAAFLIAATLIAVMVGISQFFPNPIMDRLWRLNPSGAAAFHALGRISGVFLLVLGMGTLAAAHGMLRGQKWAWWFSVLLFVANAVGDLITLFVTHEALRSVFGIMISLVFLYCLVRSRVRQYFGL